MTQTGTRKSIPTRTRFFAAVVVPALLLATGACSGGDDDEGGDSPEDALAAAKKTLDETSGVEIALTTEKLPSGVDGVIEATGTGTHAPAFEGEIKVVVNSLNVDVPVVAVEGAVYAKLPFTTQFAPIEPGDYGAPDPADLMDPDSGISELAHRGRGRRGGRPGPRRRPGAHDLHRHAPGHRRRRRDPVGRQEGRLRRDVRGRRRGSSGHRRRRRSRSTATRATWTTRSPSPTTAPRRTSPPRESRVSHP